ncbi:MAG: haloacid dehalogenase [Cyanobacteria bacterium QH_8_48_120]|nr:MAG: haloacid dehalogenase [Cyanobacteria bacterium QH_1_48_107]PSO68227.1 MAG: haloacid dehalogenase [Cyanobacteria bacterium QH_6_48_35]PSO71321.1 MAG: haloacid dehalogenase [Cyanobacteria bacterium QH_8_48_120]PSO94586.1 MAG: haloacid dehalogenase [Cyanobacteria bacterium SW_6_48_11]
MQRLITDFDGPIMDVSNRYYRVYQFCLEEMRHPQQSVRFLSKEEFWQLKRARVPQSEIGILSGLDTDQAKEFAHLRRCTVHALPYLIHDQIQPDAIEALEGVQQCGIDLAVMTMRRLQELEFALNRHDIERFFPPERCYALGNTYVKTGDVQDKTLLMERALAELPPACEVWMVGDTEADLIAAKTHNVKAIGLLGGIRDREHLQRYEPEFIVNNLAEAVDLVTAAIPVHPFSTIHPSSTN